MATLYHRNGMFYVNYVVNGRRVRKAVSENREEAEYYLAEINYQHSRGVLGAEKPEVSFDYVVKRYFDMAQSRLANSTLKRYRDSLDHFQDYLSDKQTVKHISDIRRVMLSDYVDYRLNCRPKPKANTINNELTVVGIIFNFAVESGFITENPFRRFKLLKNSDAKRGRVISSEEIEILLKGCERVSEGRWFRQILITFLNTGMRLGELLNLTWEDIDLDNGIIEIREKPFWSPKSYARIIPINNRVREILGALVVKSQSKFVFTKNGSQIPVNRLRKKLLTLSKRVGLPHITRIHDLRHTFASNLLMAGVDIPTVSALMGHRSWNTTAIYSHQTRAHTKSAIEKISF